VGKILKEIEYRYDGIYETTALFVGLQHELRVNIFVEQATTSNIDGKGGHEDSRLGMTIVHRRKTLDLEEFLRNFVGHQAPPFCCNRFARFASWLLLSCAINCWISNISKSRHVVAVEAFHFPRRCSRLSPNRNLLAWPFEKDLTLPVNNKPNGDEPNIMVPRVYSVCTTNTALRRKPTMTRKDVFREAIFTVGFATTLTTANDLAAAFEGGIGGLGKTKPATGIVLWNEDISPVLQDTKTGQISAELNVAGQPVLVSYVAPWPLLSGMEARNIATAESTFVQVVENYAPKTLVQTKSGFLEFLLQTVFASQGKFGAYAAPFDVKIVPSSLQVNDIAGMKVVNATVTFTTYTPGLRESERQVLIRAVNVFANHWVLLVAGGTRQRFRALPLAFWNDIVDTFQVALAPPSSRP
jgi:hypothetical protein